MSAWVNYDDALSQLRDFGLDVDTLKIDTARNIRCREIGGDREKRGWYRLSTIQLADREGGLGDYIVGAFGIFRGAENDRSKIDLRISKRRISLTAEQKAAMKARLAEDQKRAKAMRNAEIKRAQQEAMKWWPRFSEEGTSDYLARKQVGAHGARFTPKNDLVIPMRDTKSTVFGLQIIREKPGRKLPKQYWPIGLDKVGHFHMIGSPLASDVILVAEGFATAATIHEATGLPVAVAFDAGNLVHVALALHAEYPRARFLICADDDYLQKCRHCKTPTPVAEAACQHCGEPHGKNNPGVEAAKAAAHAVNGSSVAPLWPFDRNGEKLTDFNDLATHENGGVQHVTNRIQEALRDAGWRNESQRHNTAEPAAQGGGGGRRAAVSILSLDDAISRFLPIDDGTGEVLFDSWTQKLVKRKQMESLLPAGIRWDDVKRHPLWISRGSYYLDQVGFDPAGSDPNVLLNTWTGWPTTPAAGDCSKAIDLLRYLCSAEDNADELFNWVVKWIAYPIQNPGEKMHTALVCHGGQGTGKSILFEAIANIYGEYGILLNQGAIEDKFNSDWSSRKLFVLADEIVARQEMHHIKNQLKGFITGDWVRVNPKNLPAYRERNHMNMVFLSNERQPVVLEGDDRRYCVIWTPPALPEDRYHAVAAELENGGLEALHQFFLDVDLTGFQRWTKPPMTGSKRDLQDLGRGSVEQFIAEWMAVELEHPGTGNLIPFCPCLGTDLFNVYEKWCERSGEHKRSLKQLIGHVKKLNGWRAGSPQPTWRNYKDRSTLSRKLVVPSDADMVASIENDSDGTQEQLQPDRFETKKDWLTKCFLEFRAAAGIES